MSKFERILMSSSALDFSVNYSDMASDCEYLTTINRILIGNQAVCITCSKIDSSSILTFKTKKFLTYYYPSFFRLYFGKFNIVVFYL